MEATKGTTFHTMRSTDKKIQEEGLFGTEVTILLAIADLRTWFEPWLLYSNPAACYHEGQQVTILVFESLPPTWET